MIVILSYVRVQRIYTFTPVSNAKQIHLLFGTIRVSSNYDTTAITIGKHI